MSIQSVIDYGMTPLGGSNRVIDVTGEGGNVVVPKGLNVSLSDCSVNDFESLEGSIIDIRKGSIYGTVKVNKGHFMVRNVERIGGSFNFVGGEVVFLNCQISSDITIQRGSVHFINCSFFGSLIAEEGSHVQMDNVSCTGEYIRVLEDSSLIANDTTLSSLVLVNGTSRVSGGSVRNVSCSASSSLRLSNSNAQNGLIFESGSTASIFDSNIDIEDSGSDVYSLKVNASNVDVHGELTIREGVRVNSGSLLVSGAVSLPVVDIAGGDLTVRGNGNNSIGNLTVSMNGRVTLYKTDVSDLEVSIGSGSFVVLDSCSNVTNSINVQGMLMARNMETLGGVVVDGGNVLAKDISNDLGVSFAASGTGKIGVFNSILSTALALNSGCRVKAIDSTLTANLPSTIGVSVLEVRGGTVTVRPSNREVGIGTGTIDVSGLGLEDEDDNPVNSLSSTVVSDNGVLNTGIYKVYT